jgi:hypothetical protein
MDIERRLTNLENLVSSLIKRIDNDKFYNNADKDGIRCTDKSNNEARQADIDFIAMEAGIDLDQE